MLKRLSGLAAFGLFLSSVNMSIAQSTGGWVESFSNTFGYLHLDTQAEVDACLDQAGHRRPREINEPTAAIEKCRIAIQLDADSAEMRLSLARAYLANNQPDEAVETLEVAAAQGHIPAAIMLGKMYRQGDDVFQNFTRSMEWYIFAAEAGDGPAQVQVARNYAEGKGAMQNEALSLEWYQIAADQGNPVAEHYLEGRRIAEARRAREQEQEVSREQEVIAQAAEYRALCAEGEYQRRRNSCKTILRSSEYSDIEGLREFAIENLRITQLTQCDMAVKIGHHPHLVSDPVDHPASLTEQACIAIRQSSRFSQQEKEIAEQNINILDGISDGNDMHLATLRGVIAGDRFDVYMIDAANDVCRQASDFPSDRTDVTRFSLAGYGNAGQIFDNGAIEVPWESRIITEYRSDAASVAARCVEPRGWRATQISEVTTTDSGIAYAWSLKLTDGYCHRQAVYTDCRTECVQWLDRGTPVFYFALTKDFAEELSGVSCQ